jgi:peptidylprolyl isomerase
VTINSALAARLIVVPVAAAVLALSACGGPNASTSASSAAGSASASSSAAAGAPTGSASDAAASPSPSGIPAVTSPVASTKIGVKVTGKLGDKPALTVPSGAAPTDVSIEALQPGTGAVVGKGDMLVVNYLGQTWAPKDGKPYIFDNSYDHLAPTAFGIGIGQVIKGWDQTLVGQKIGSRVLVSIPPALAYGASPSAQNPLAGQALLFVVDVLASYDSKTSAATGTVVTTPPPAGLPTVDSQVGKQPKVTDVKGVKPGAAPVSGLLIKGDGAPIDEKKSLIMQIVESDAATGTQSQATWGQALQSASAGAVLNTVEVLKGAPVGSRAVVVTAQSASQPASILVVDIIAQY